MPYLTDYLFYASENEASPRFHKWAALLTLSVALNRRCYVEQGAWNVYPNLYLFFVGPPASGKSVAMELAEKLVHDFTDLEIAASSITREALLKTLGTSCKRELIINGQVSEYCPLVMFSDELVFLLGREPMLMMDTLTALYGCPSVLKNDTKNQGKDHIKNACVIIHACLTPKTLTGMLQQNLVSGGFSRRMLMVYNAVRGPANPWPSRTPLHDAAKQRCVGYAKQVQKLVGAFSIEPDAREYFSIWYTTKKDPAMRNETNPVMQAWYTIKDQHVLKLSMLLSVAESLTMTIKIHHIQEALTLIDELEPDILSILGGGGRNDLAAVTVALERYIRDNPVGVSKQMLLLAFRNDANDMEINSILRHLLDVAAIEVSQKIINGIRKDIYTSTLSQSKG